MMVFTNNLLLLYPHGTDIDSRVEFTRSLNRPGFLGGWVA